jgi:hypothetical protein
MLQPFFMRALIFAIIFIIIGIAAALATVHFALLPVTSDSTHPINTITGEVQVTKDNVAMASLAMAIISAGSFIASAIILGSNKKN